MVEYHSRGKRHGSNIFDASCRVDRLLPCVGSHGTFERRAWSECSDNDTNDHQYPAGFWQRYFRTGGKLRGDLANRPLPLTALDKSCSSPLAVQDPGMRGLEDVGLRIVTQDVAGLDVVVVD